MFSDHSSALEVTKRVGNQNSLVEGGTLQWKTKTKSTKVFYKTLQNNLQKIDQQDHKNPGELICCGRVSNSCSISGTCCVHEYHLIWKSWWTPVCANNQNYAKYVWSYVLCVGLIPHLHWRKLGRMGCTVVFLRFENSGARNIKRK